MNQDDAYLDYLADPLFTDPELQLAGDEIHDPFEGRLWCSDLVFKCGNKAFLSISGHRIHAMSLFRWMNGQWAPVHMCRCGKEPVQISADGLGAVFACAPLHRNGRPPRHPADAAQSQMVLLWSEAELDYAAAVTVFARRSRAAAPPPLTQDELGLPLLL